MAHRSNRSSAYVIVVLALVAGCTRVPPSPYNLYVIGDTLTWDCGPNGGYYTVLRNEGRFVDSVDLGFGVHELSDGVLFAPVASVEDSPFETFTCPQDPVLVQGATRRPLAEVLPLFDPAFPAITVLDSNVFYWGFRQYRIYAIRFGLLDGAADSTFLTENQRLFATDNRFQFLKPEITSSGVVFGTLGLRFHLDSSMQLVMVDTIPR